MARYWCERCGQECNTLSEPHLCADIAKRLAKRQRQIDTAREILDEWIPQVGAFDRRLIAEDIVAKLAGMGVADD